MNGGLVDGRLPELQGVARRLGKVLWTDSLIVGRPAERLHHEYERHG